MTIHPPCPAVTSIDFYRAGIGKKNMSRIRYYNQKEGEIFPSFSPRERAEYDRGMNIANSLHNITAYIAQYNKAYAERSLIQREGYIRSHKLASALYLFLTLLVLAAIGGGLYGVAEAGAPTWSLPLIALGGVALLGTITTLPWFVCKHLHSKIAGHCLGPLALLFNPFQLIYDLICTTKETELARNQRELEENFSKIRDAWTLIDGTDSIELARRTIQGATPPYLLQLQGVQAFLNAGCYHDVVSAPQVL